MFKEKIRIQLLGGSLTDHGSYTDGNYQGYPVVITTESAVYHVRINAVSAQDPDNTQLAQYLERREVPGDRRKTELICTEKTENVWRQGCEIQRTFIETLFSGISAESRKVFEQVMEQTEENLNTYQKENKKK